MRRREHELSSRGEAPTELERALFVEALAGAPSTNPWLAIAQRIGLDALAVVLDELGGEKVHVPERRHFFGEMYRRRRDTRLRELKARGHSSAEIAVLTGVPERTVRHVLATAGNGTTLPAACGKRGAA